MEDNAECTHCKRAGPVTVPFVQSLLLPEFYVRFATRQGFTSHNTAGCTVHTIRTLHAYVCSLCGVHMQMVTSFRGRYSLILKQDSDSDGKKNQVANYYSKNVTVCFPVFPATLVLLGIYLIHFFASPFAVLVIFNLLDDFFFSLQEYKGT